MFRTLGGVAVLATAWLTVAAPRAIAHGGVPSIQLAAERINPGGTVDLLGDMTTEGSVAIELVAPAQASRWPLGTVEADFEGHFRAFLTLPADAPAGEYRVRAVMATEEASSPIVIDGPPIRGEEGQLPGQDEALAGITPNPGYGSTSVIPAVPSTPRSDGVGLLATIAVVAVIVAVALGVGWLARIRTARLAGRPRD